MVYVASPYLDIAENLLTALTGGIAREEATFQSGEPYYFENPPVKPDSVRVVGIREKEIYHFTAGQDFIADLDKITWSKEDGAKWPDIESKFYINYYNANTEPVLTDTNVGSVTRTLAEAFARELASISKQLLLVYNSGFLNTARGDSLDQVVAILGEKYARKSGDYAIGDVLFFRNTPAPADIFINDGLLVSTEISSKSGEPKVYETIQEKILRKGQVSVLVPVRAVKKGQDGITESRSVRIMIQPVMGIDGVINPKEILPSGREETDEELRDRAKHALEAAGGTTSNALKYALMSMPELTGVDIKIEEDFSQGNGLVRVYIDIPEKKTGNSTDTKSIDDLVVKINQKIFETKAAGIRVVHNLSKSEEGVSTKLKVDLKKKSVAVRVTVSLEDESISSSKKEGIKSQVSSEVKAYFEKLRIGESVLRNKLIALLFNIEGVKDVQINFKDAKGEILADLIPTESNERIILADSIPAGSSESINLPDKGLQVLISGLSVFVDVKIQAVMAVDKELEKSSIEKSLKDKTSAFISSTGKKLSVKDFNEALKGNNYTITSLVFDLEYLETGLIKHNVTQGEEGIGENENFVSRKIEIEFK